MWVRRLVTATVLAHFFIAGWHGFTHQLVPVPLDTFQTVFVVVVIITLPLIDAVLCYSRLALAGALLVVAAMTISLTFGVIYHFVVVTVDNVWCVPDWPWRASFLASAVLVGLSEAIGVVVGAYAGYRLMDGRTTCCSANAIG